MSSKADSRAKKGIKVSLSARGRMHFDMRSSTAYEEKQMVAKQLKLQHRANKNEEGK
jgi:hypothetical protein